MSAQSSPAPASPTPYSADPTLYLYTSLTAGSSHIITATSRLETILKANKIPFRAIDVATDEKARMLWGRRSKGRKLPGLVRTGLIVGDLEEIEEWNEYGELDEHLGDIPKVTPASTPSKGGISAAGTPAAGTPLREMQSNSETNTPSKGVVPTPLTLALRQAGEEAAKKATANKTTTKSSTPSAPAASDPISITTESTSTPEPGMDSDTSALKSVIASPPLPEPEPAPDHSKNSPGEIISSSRSIKSPDEKKDEDHLAVAGESTSLVTKEEAKAETDTNPAPAAADTDTTSKETPASSTQTPFHPKALDLTKTSSSSRSPINSPRLPLSPQGSNSPSRTTSATSQTVTHTHHGHSHTHTYPESPSFSPPISQHRGSSISLVSEEEIREIEKAQAIMEEEEDSDSETKPPAPHVTIDDSTPGENDEALLVESPEDTFPTIGQDLLSAHIREELGENGQKAMLRSLSVNERKADLQGEYERHVSFAGAPDKAAKEKRAVLSKLIDQEGGVTKAEEKEKTETQEQGAKEAEKAGESVED